VPWEILVREEIPEKEFERLWMRVVCFNVQGSSKRDPLREDYFAIEGNRRNKRIKL